MKRTIENSTIMVVDDTPANLKLLTDILQVKGYLVLAFPRGALALAAAAKNPPDLILLDINMPEMNGFEVCNRLKADDTLKDIPVIFITAMSETEDKVKAFNMGCVDYVTKPFQCEEVNARVESHLRMRKMQLELERHNNHLEDLVKEKVHEISESRLAAIVALAKLAESRDDDTGDHVERTRTFCRLLAEKLQEHPRYAKRIDKTYVENIFHSAPLHDIGKVGISDNILLKPTKLSSEEFEIMKTHPIIGAKTLQAARSQYPRNNFLNMGLEIAHSHHEKWNGSGYPKGLAGDSIPLSARIMAVADVYDALRSARPYKAAFSHEKSCKIIFEGSGSHFDPVLIEAFAAIEPEFARIREQMDDNSNK
jgi:putative two-component system response regulator